MFIIKSARKKAGQSPGTLMYVGAEKVEKVKIQIIDYNGSDLAEKEVGTIKDCLPFKTSDSVTWINVTGIHDLTMIENLGSQFNLHPLLLEDVVNTEQRPKMDDYEDYLFMVLKMLYTGKNSKRIQHEQLSLILMPGVVLSLQEFEEDVFDPVRERIRKGKGHIRTKGSDYLMYALIDTIVDHYFHLFEEIGEQVEALQEEVITDPQPKTLHQIQNLKREMIFLRKSVWPLREIISALVRGEYSLVHEDVVLYLRDVYDHTIQVIDTVETYRDMLSGMLDIYLSSVSNKMNEVMKVLTIIATIFIPLTFLAGVYGMNFKYMPELEFKWAYPILWIIMISVFGLMLIYFKRKKWL
ncbi:MAG: magnesium/cobalt transporter CorA [Desulfobacterales bacterium]|nr:magnesium/cobalt transporter CorA [Desulfobacterales bacterium]